MSLGNKLKEIFWQHIVSFDDIKLESGQAFQAKNWSMEAVQVAFCVEIGAETTGSCLQASERCH